MQSRLRIGGCRSGGGDAGTVRNTQAAGLGDQRNRHDVVAGTGQRVLGQAAGVLRAERVLLGVDRGHLGQARAVALEQLRQGDGQVMRGADPGAGVDVPELGGFGHGRTCDAGAQVDLVHADGLDSDVFLARPVVAEVGGCVGRCDFGGAGVLRELQGVDRCGLRCSRRREYRARKQRGETGSHLHVNLSFSP